MRIGLAGPGDWMGMELHRILGGEDTRVAWKRRQHADGEVAMHLCFFSMYGKSLIQAIGTGKLPIQGWLGFVLVLCGMWVTGLLLSDGSSVFISPPK